jgi:Fe-S-cluster-containing dehydrogenase component
MNVGFELMMKCDMCYDRTSAGLKPMCATVCPSGALSFGTLERMEIDRPRSEPMNQFQFGGQRITTKVRMMAPRGRTIEHLDVTAAMNEPLVPSGPTGGFVSIDALMDAMHLGGEEPRS